MGEIPVKEVVVIRPKRTSNEDIESRVGTLENKVENGFKDVNKRLDDWNLNGGMVILRRLIAILDSHSEILDVMEKNARHKAENRIAINAIGRWFRIDGISLQYFKNISLVLLGGVLTGIGYVAGLNITHWLNTLLTRHP